LVDDDVVEASNLQRQVLYRTDDIGRLKVEVAAERVRALNPDVSVDTYAERLSSVNAMEIFADYDVIVDGTDNFPTRYLSNDACVILGKPNVYGSIFRFEGQASVFDARTGPCYRCLFPEPPPPGSMPSCAEGGVLGVLPGIIATIQATETIKLLVGKGRSLSGRLLLYDALGMEFNEFQLKKDPDCLVCGESPSITELVDYQGFCGLPSLDGAPSSQRKLHSVSAAAVAESLRAKENFLLLDVRNDDEFARAKVEGSTLVPLPVLEERLAELSPWKTSRVVVLCHLGGRSEKACRMLMEGGFESIENLEGGIDAWSLTVDPQIPRY
jgi:molybdopterin/thiamine biosynthesis adenylyltransferase/rhodanese-related sulfurtransferase